MKESAQRAPTIFVVDDEPLGLEFICDVLTDEDIAAVPVSSGAGLLELLRHEKADLIMLDVLMPGGLDGYETCRRLKDQAETRDVPVVFMSGLADTVDKVKGLKLGAVDYIAKPIEPAELLARVRTHLSLGRMKALLQDQNQNLERMVVERTRELVEANGDLLKWAQIFQHANWGVVVGSADGHVTELVNPAFAEMHGYTVEELVGQPNSLVVAPGSHGYTDAVTGSPSDREGAAFEAEHIRKDRTVFPVLVDCTTVRDASGNALNRVAYVQDITESRKARDALLESEAKFRNLVETSQDLVWRCDAEGRIAYLNPAWEQSHEYGPEEMIGHPFADFQSPEVAASDQRVLEDFLGSGKSFMYETTHLSKSGKNLSLSFNAMCRTDDEGRVVSTQGTAHDLTEQRAAEKLIEVQRQQLIQADKLSSLGTLVAGVAHEINSPNHAIRSNARRIGQAWESIVPILDAYYKESGDFLVGGVEYTEMREDMGGYIDDLGKCSSRINRIVEDLKGFYRQGALEMARISVNHVVGSAVTLMGSYIDDHTSRFTTDLGEALPDIDGDFQTLEQVVINLLTNACQSLENRGRAITLTTSLRESDGSVLIETKDEGVGIPRDHLDKLTNPFFSTNRDSGGTGLGLSISNAIINAHGGALSIASELGRGTVVEIRLPVDSDATGRA